MFHILSLDISMLHLSVCKSRYVYYKNIHNVPPYRGGHGDHWARRQKIIYCALRRRLLPLDFRGHPVRSLR